MDREKVIKAVEDLLEALGEDGRREGLRDTPRRVADAYAELLAGEGQTAEEHLSRTFNSDSGDMVVASAYIPDGKVVGLSKLARTVEVFSKRLQIQERLTRQIAEEIMRVLKPKGVFVACEAEHTCMTCRGVKKAGSKTVTYCALGDFGEDKRKEVLALLK